MNNKRLVCSVGIYDSSEPARVLIGGKKVLTPAYQSWAGMLSRCYSKKRHAQQSSYVGYSVCSEWIRFSEFKKWFDENYKEGFQLDKDLKLKGNKIYGPDTCLFIPQDINKLIRNSNIGVDNLPVGVYKRSDNGRFRATVCIDSKRVNLGTYGTINEALESYNTAKDTEIIRKSKIYPELKCFLLSHLSKTELGRSQTLFTAKGEQWINEKLLIEGVI